MEKTCTKCGETKDVGEFYKKEKNKDGLCSWCKSCEKKRYLLWYKNNSQKVIDNANKWKLENPDRRKEICNKWYHINPKRAKKVYDKVNLKKRNTLDGKLNSSMSCLIRNYLKGNKAGRHWENLVDYSLPQLKKHLEKQFDKNMNWDNYGSYWWIDHIIPVSKHHFSKPEDIDFKRCWALKNLRPLEKIENINKSNKLIKPFQPALKIMGA